MTTRGYSQTNLHCKTMDRRIYSVMFHYFVKILSREDLILDSFVNLQIL
jgi:hypothetical protein